MIQKHFPFFLFALLPLLHFSCHQPHPAQDKLIALLSHPRSIESLQFHVEPWMIGGNLVSYRTGAVSMHNFKKHRATAFQFSEEDFRRFCLKKLPSLKPTQQEYGILYTHAICELRVKGHEPTIILVFNQIGDMRIHFMGEDHPLPDEREIFQAEEMFDYLIKKALIQVKEEERIRTQFCDANQIVGTALAEIGKRREDDSMAFSEIQTTIIPFLEQLTGIQSRLDSCSLSHVYSRHYFNWYDWYFDHEPLDCDHRFQNLVSEWLDDCPEILK
ncbi:MAG: hypothetical protein AAF587_23910 [Bacteroidota bacterium]